MPKKQPKVIAYGPIVPPESAHGYRNARWVENVSHGLRLVGFADEIAHKEGSRSIDHKGWYCDDPDFGEVFRGIVYQLPSRGEPLYVYGYADPNNDDCAFLSFDPESDKLDAARAADSFAERFAEEERDYQEACRAGRRCEDLAEEVKEMRKQALAIGSEMRAARGVVEPARLTTICATLRSEIRSLYHAIQKARKERAELIETFGQRPGFAE